MRFSNSEYADIQVFINVNRNLSERGNFYQRPIGSIRDIDREEGVRFFIILMRREDIHIDITGCKV
jgi:hypothetical protein